MQTFIEYLSEKDPEILEGNFLQNMAMAGALTMGLGGGAANAANPVPAVAPASDNITVQKSYDFDSSEDIRDAVEEATLEIKAKIAKMYGAKVLSGIARPDVKINKKNQTVIVTIAVPKQLRDSVLKTTPTPNPVSVQKRVSKSAF
jgi:hypothetical protein